MGLRILHAIRSVDPAGGGPIEGVKQLSGINTKLGHSVEVVCLDDPGSSWLTSVGVPVHALGPASGSYGYSSRYVPWLKANAYRYDCVVVNGIWGYNCFGTWRALKDTKTPYFVFTHGMLDPWFKVTFPLKHAKKWLYWFWGGYPALRDAMAVFFTCEEERRLARESFWLYDCHEFVITYGTGGINVEPQSAVESFLAANPALRGKRLILFLGRVHPKKGPDLMIEAVAKLIAEKKWDRENLRMVMAGPVTGEYAGELKHRISKLGLEDVFYWTGMILGSQKWGAISAAEVFILPSHQENFGLAVAEALSAGVPVLLGKGVNIWPEIVAANAGLAEMDTVNGCKKLLEDWIHLPESAKGEMRIAAREIFEGRFTSEKAANTFVAALYLLLGTKDQDV